MINQNNPREKKSILKYFNLNEQAKKNVTVLEFGIGVGKSKDDKIVSGLEQFVAYSCVFFGILFSKFIFEFSAGEMLMLDISWLSVLASLIIAFLIFPYIFEKIDLVTNTPILVRIGIYLQHGVFWQTLFNGIGKIS